MQRPIDIIILTHNRLRYLFRTIDALLRNTSYPFNITVVDNASTEPGMKRYLRQAKEHGVIFQLFEQSSNTWHRGWQEGINRTISNPFCITDPDILVPKAKPCWLTRLLGCYYENPRFARIGLLLQVRNHPLNPDKRDIRECDVRPKGGINSDITLTWLDTTLQLVDRRIFEQTRGFNFKDPGPPMQDINKMGYHCGLYNKIAGTHLGWSEWKDYPEYLAKKNHETPWNEYGELSLIKREHAYA